MSFDAQLVLRQDPARMVVLQREVPTTIGRAESNRLRLTSLDGVSDHHAVVRFSRGHGWVVCDWQSLDGTFLEGERVSRCRRLSDGDEIQLGARGPVLIFRLRQPMGSDALPGPVAVRSTPARAPAPASPSGRGEARASGAAAPARRPINPLVVEGVPIPLDQILSAHVRSRPRYPHSFSWWVLLCLGGLVLLPFAWLFWSVQIVALAGWIVLGSRKQHELVITLRDGMAHRHRFANRITALSHRNGIRKAIGQSIDSG